MVRYMPWGDKGPHLTRLDTVPTQYADAPRHKPATVAVPRPGMVIGMRDDGTPCELEDSSERKPATVAVTAEEGGEWIAWEDWSNDWQRFIERQVHAIKFADGSIWDAVNGWRDKT